MGISQTFSQSLRWVHQLLNIPIPVPVQNLDGSQTADSRLINFWMSGLLAAKDLSVPSGSRFRLQLALNSVRMTPGFQAKIQRASAFWIFPDDWQVVPLPDRLFWFYFILRPFLWLGRGFLFSK